MGIKLRIRKLHYYLLMFNMAFFGFLLYLLVYYCSGKPDRYWGMVMFRRWWAHLSTFFAGIFFKFEFERAIDWSKTYVICAYHTSNLDSLMISILVKNNKFSFMGKDELKEGLVTGIYFRTVDLPVDRNSKMAAFRAFKTAAGKLANGTSIIMFPEGGIADDFPPKVQEFKSGAFRLAIEQKVPIIPVSSINTWQTFWDDGLKYGSKPGICNVFVHKPIQTAHLEVRDADALRDEVKRLIEEKINEPRVCDVI